MLLCSIHKIHTLYYPCEYTKLYRKKNEFSPQCTCEYYLETKMKKTQNVPRIKYSPFHFYFFFAAFFQKDKNVQKFLSFSCKRVSKRKKLYQHLKYAFCTTTTVTLLLLASSSSSSLPFFIAFSRGFYACFYRKTKILLLRSRNYLLAKKKNERKANCSFDMKNLVNILSKLFFHLF